MMQWSLEDNGRVFELEFHEEGWHWDLFHRSSCLCLRLEDGSVNWETTFMQSPIGSFMEPFCSLDLRQKVQAVVERMTKIRLFL
jgi:hypothetical protein